VEGPRTFEEAFRSDYAPIVRVVAPIVGSLEDAESVTQEAFVKAYTRWRRVGSYDRPGAWIRRVAIRDAVRFAHRHSRVIDAVPRIEDASDRTATNLDLDAALAQLPARQRAAVVLHYLADWPTAEVADALGCSESTVRVHLHRGRAALADRLAPQPEELTDGR
jgi:RNA polymerase sigma-70 factor (ECF subfamily)